MRDSSKNCRCPLGGGVPKVMEGAGRRQRKGLAQPLGLAPPAVPAANLHTEGSHVCMRHAHNCPCALRNHFRVIFVSMCGLQIGICFVLWMSLIPKLSNHCHVVSEPLCDSVFLLKMRLMTLVQFTTQCHGKDQMSLGI